MTFLLNNRVAFLVTFLVSISPLIAAEDNSDASAKQAFKSFYLPTAECGQDEHKLTHDQNHFHPESECQKQQPTATPLPQWLTHSSLRHAPLLLKGVYNYLSSRRRSAAIPSFHRLILVGKPGTGKTTLAYALADALSYKTIFIPASSLLGHYYNETAVNLQQAFQAIMTDDATKKMVIIDELHKLFEHHKETKSDHSQTAATFWLILDQLEKHHPNVVVIATANEVSKLPPEIKSRFHGKIITVSMPSTKQKQQAFKNIIAYDCSVMLDQSADDTFLTEIISQCKGCSLRDIQLLIDTAKMYYYASAGNVNNDRCILLKREHFKRALSKLNKEFESTKESFIDKIYSPLKKWSVVISTIASCMSISRMTHEWYKVVTGHDHNLGYSCPLYTNKNSQ
jgi:broad-specificity NMP kinase